MPQLDITTFASQIFWLTITFATLFILMWRVAVPRISETFEKRRQKIAGDLERAEQLKKEAEAVLEAYEQALAGAREEAQAAVFEAQSQLKAEADERETALAGQIKQDLEQAEASIAAAKEKALEGLRDVAVEVASSATERLAGETPADSDIGPAVDKVLKARG